MNKRIIIILTLIIFAVAFGVAGYFYKKDTTSQPVETSQPAPVEQPAAKEANLLIRPHSPIMGKVDARVTIVEFIDPACEACRAYFPYVESLREQYPNDLRVIYRFVPFHPGSPDAIKILLAANKQGLFHPVMEGLFATQDAWSPHHKEPDLEKAWAVAVSKGVDIEKAKADIQTPEIQDIVSLEKEDVQSFMIRQTPTFFIDGQKLQSSGPIGLNDAIVAAMKNIQPKQ